MHTIRVTVLGISPRFMSEIKSREIHPRMHKYTHTFRFLPRKENFLQSTSRHLTLFERCSALVQYLLHLCLSLLNGRLEDVFTLPLVLGGPISVVLVGRIWLCYEFCLTNNLIFQLLLVWQACLFILEVCTSPNITHILPTYIFLT